MRAFFGGQIAKDCRGDLATIIIREPKGSVQEEFYSVLIEDLCSEEFIHLTGMGDVRSPVERVYMGVSKDIGEDIARKVNRKPVGSVDFRAMDASYIIPYFLNKNLEKPEQITLKSTRDGYKLFLK